MNYQVNLLIQTICSLLSYIINIIFGRYINDEYAIIITFGTFGLSSILFY